MRRSRIHDPRTVAREIPGVFDSIFPQLTPGVVAHFNRDHVAAEVEPIRNELVQQSSLQKAMLFELACAAAESLVAKRQIDWDECIVVAVERQRQYFDAEIPNGITDVDMIIVEMVAQNIQSMLEAIARARGSVVLMSPAVPGFQWVSSGEGDFSIADTLIEVKCSRKNFSASDYRQLVMYWLLSYASSMERGSVEWTRGVLLNPRLAKYVELDFNHFLHVISAGRTKVEILQLFTAMIDSRHVR
jgi:hypothetical protein